VGKYVKFKPKSPLNWDPVQVDGWRVGATETQGTPHQGLFVTLVNDAAHPVRARLRVELADVAPQGGSLFFFSEVSLREGERKNAILRTIPDEGIPTSDRAREMLLEDFKVRRVEVVDTLF
jgi:hypothetical protein